MPLKPHPTDPDKMVFVKAEYNLPKPWAELTDEDLKPICNEWRIIYGAWVEDFARAIEAKLKEKNT
jgi:hypothetical protein